jgi:hypothetical protein
MKPKLQKLGTVAALLVMAATGQAGAADPRHDDKKVLLAVSLSVDAAPHFPMRPGQPENLLPPAYDARLLRQSAAPARSVKDLARSEEISAAGMAFLPEPGNWSMVLIGLLGVGAIARRRMSA